ncbi:MAG: HlyC/CorC family transporter, partial [Methylococcales bacterium]|nr:HlyC/CorC family transporter [Methylococcales bacterium]
GVRPTQLEQRASEGNNTAAALLGVVQDADKQDRYIATAQLGITIASLGLGMYGEPKIAGIIEPFLAKIMGVTDPHAAIVTTVGYIVSLSLLTYAHIVVGEMVPKSLALSSPIKTVLSISPVMNIFQLIMSPFVSILNMVGNGTMRLFGVPLAQGNERIHSPEEIEFLVTQSTEEGLLDFGQEEMIRNIFDFSERTVAQVMTPRRKVQAIDATMSYEQVKKIVTASNYSRLPVFKNDLDHVIGVLHLKDLVKFDLTENSPTTWRTLLRQVPAVPENYKVEKLLAGFKLAKMHMAVVLDEFGGIAGIVTLEDLVEEVVGEVRDEFDHELEPIIKLGEGVIEVDGEFLVDDLRDYLEKYT